MSLYDDMNAAKRKAFAENRQFDAADAIEVAEKHIALERRSWAQEMLAIGQEARRRVLRDRSWGTRGIK